MPVIENNVEAIEVLRTIGGDARDQLVRGDPSLSALSMIGAPCASSAPRKCTWLPAMRW